MNTPEDIQLQNTKIDFFQLAKREPNPRTRIRFLALGHLKAGKSKQEVSEIVSNCSDFIASVGTTIYC